MKNFILTFILLTGLANAAPVLTLNPSNGAVQAEPGATTGWGFTLTSDDTRWLSVIGSVLLTESNPSLGFYTDFIGALGGPVDFTLAPQAPAWTLNFDNSLGLGIGSFTLNANATLGAVNSGTLRVIAELYSADPNLCGGNCIVDTITLDVPFSVTSDVPEPATLLLVPGLLLILARHKRAA